MKFKDFLFALPFFLILFCQTYLIATFNISIDPALAQAQSSYPYMGYLIKVDFFTFFVFLSILCSINMMNKLRDEIGLRKKIIGFIFVYFVYQVIIILPLSYLDKMGSVRDIVFALVPRFALLLIPFFFWFVLPAFKKPEKLLNWFNLSAIFLVLGAYLNYRSGSVYATNTGQIRMLSAGSVAIFGLSFIINFFKSKRSFWNYLYIALSLLGLIAANYRAAYVFLFLVVLIGVWIMGKTGSRLKTFIMSILVIATILFSFAQNGVVWSSFYQRIESINLQDENAQVRFEYWRQAYDRFTDSPLNGSMAQGEYYRSMYVSDYPAPHNFVFEILPTQGVVGLLFILYLLTTSIVIGIRNRRDEMSLQMLLSLTFYVLFSTFNPIFLNPWVMPVLIVTVSVLLYRDKALSGGVKISD